MTQASEARAQAGRALRSDLTERLRTWGARPFEYGSADCLQFVAHMTGIEVPCDYSTLREGESKYRSVVRVMDERLDRTDGPQTGGVCLLRIEDEACLGVCMGALVLAQTPAGLRWAGAHEAIRSWS